jgi:hypothetical protein
MNSKPALLPGWRGQTRLKPMNTKPTPPPAVRKWYSQIGKLGGKSKSPAKLAAIAQNAKKGGWPKGRSRKVG